MKSGKLMLALAGVVLASAAQAGPADLARAKACLSCHSIDNKVVGPSFKAVAAKYRGNKGAVALLTQKIRKGGSGVWGSMAMPPAAVTEAEAKQLAEWVLSIK